MDYKEILKGIVNIINTTEKSDVGFANICSYVGENCPELKESEDEKIRKEIISALQHANHKGVYDKHLAWLEKQGEKPANKLEQKFKVGDWIVDKSGLAQQVLDFRGGIYTCTYNSFTTDSESNYHLWTIQDAKDGDVLYSLDSKQPFIYKERPQFSQAIGYCCINKFGGFAIWNTSKCVICTDKYIPATKEQRDLLFKKMKEAGYEWDAEKKELTKIKQNSAWSEEDEEKLNQLHNLIVKKAYEEYEIDTEDETLYGKWLKLDNWLKSLKPQPQWKPSEEQIKDFGGALLILKLQHYASSERLESLYEQLKKL